MEFSGIGNTRIGSGAGAVLPKASAIRGEIARLEDCTKRVATIRDEARDEANRLLGPQPENDVVPDMSQSDDCDLAVLSLTIRRLILAIADLADHVRRFRDV